MNVPRHHPKGAPASAFTLIEVIGVLSLLAITAGLFVPSVARGISRTRGAADAAEIARIGEALLRHASLHQEIPGAQSWATAAARLLDCSEPEIRYAVPTLPSTARVYLVHPEFTPSDASGVPGRLPDPVWSQGIRGTRDVGETRALILSVHHAGLALPFESGPAASAAAFEAVWNWHPDPSTDAPPPGWPPDWERNGRYLHVARINFRPLFRTVTFGNTQPDERLAPAVAIGQHAPVSLDATPVFLARYLEGTVIRLFRAGTADDPGRTLQIAHVLRSDVNFVYADEHWSIP